MTMKHSRSLRVLALTAALAGTACSSDSIIDPSDRPQPPPADAFFADFSFFEEIDTLVQSEPPEALELTRDTDAPAANILYAGLERHEEGTDRVMKAIENVGLIEMAQLERGLIILATLSNVAPLLGFLGTVIGMIQAFQAIESAGEVEATLVAGGIKVALITTAAGLVIAIPINVMHNYFVTRIDRLVIDMEESAQKMIDTLHEMERGAAPVRR